jgi:hypothetical protein
MGALYDELCGYENLYWIFRRARKGKRHQEAVARFECRLEDELFGLQGELLAQTFRPGPYRSLWRTEAKRQLISAAALRDRVIHHALVAGTEAAFERRFIVFPDHRRLRPARGRDFRRRLLRLGRAYAAGLLPAARVTQSARSWAAHAAHGDTWGLRRAVLGQALPARDRR